MVQTKTSKFDSFTRLRYVNTNNKRVLVYCRNELDLTDLKELFLERKCNLMESQTFDDDLNDQLVCSTKFIADERIDLVIVLGPIRPEHFAYYDQHFDLIALASRESLLCYFNEHYERTVYYENIDDIRQTA